MLICPSCHNEQESGKFCGVCGEKLESAAANANAVATQEGPVNTGASRQAADAETAGTAETGQRQNETADKIKNGLDNYWHYFLELMKNPTGALYVNEGQLLNGVITLIIFALASSISVYFLANSIVGGMISVPFFSFTFQLLFVAVVFLALAFASTLMMTKAAKNQDSVKTLLTQFGSLAVPFAAINIVAILAGLAGSSVFTMLLLAVSYALFLYFVPALFVYEKANQVSRNGHKVYISLAAVLIMTVLTFFVSGIMLSDMIDSIADMLSFSPF